ncbi:uncharacterized protein LOC130087002 [Rhinichthys klamathensis goyatoka]|uniref:uncharacterized protein LOC130087002 n=1 Tax=Rhinichthys klamathensis goyatoka TaxID=3034132 RepID=UPI0024B58A1F|nr:uncharacterized protein LOC130087002 [Rhinichthys klamathensis goyatoka]
MLSYVFGDAEKVSVPVIEGQSVTLHTGVTEIQKYDLIEWRLNRNRIARISGDNSSPEGAFRDGLQLDKQTGDLKITNIKTTDSGEYKLKITSTRGFPVQTFNVSVVTDPRSDGVTVVSVTEGDSVVLHADVTKILKDDEILWRFRDKYDIAIMKKDEDIFSTYDYIADGIFRRRLQLNHQTGNLIISDITYNTSGLYEVDIKRRTYTIHKAFNVTVTDKLNRVSVKEGVTVILESGVTELDRDDLVQWRFEHEDVLAEINKTAGISSSYDDVPDGRFRERLKLDNQTGSLTITHTRTEDSGLYHLEITSDRHIIFRKFVLSVCGE